jgi:phosphoglycolate phosphatase
MARRTVVIFDFDGTLADTMADLVDGLTAAFGSHFPTDGGPPREQILRLMQLPPREMMRRFVDITGWPAARVQSEFMPVTASLPTRLFPEVTGVLVALKQAGYTIAISTNTPEGALWDRIRQAGIADQCDFALGTNLEHGITKDDHPRLAAERLGLSAQDFANIGVYVGDLPTDMQLARKAGLLAIGRSTGANAEALTVAGAQHVIGDLTELEPLFHTSA